MRVALSTHPEAFDLIAEVRFDQPYKISRLAMRNRRLQGCMFFGGEAYPYRVELGQVAETGEKDQFTMPIQLTGNRQVVLRILPGDTFRSLIGKNVVIGRICRVGGCGSGAANTPP